MPIYISHLHVVMGEKTVIVSGSYHGVGPGKVNFSQSLMHQIRIINMRVVGWVLDQY